MKLCKEVNKVWQRGKGRWGKKLEERKRRRGEICVQAIYERSPLCRSGRLCEVRHMSSTMDWEASVNECDNNHTIPPCFSGSRMTHPSVTVLWWSVALLCMCACTAERWLQNNTHTHTHTQGDVLGRYESLVWRAVWSQFSPSCFRAHHCNILRFQERGCVCVCVVVVVVWGVWV